MSSRRHWVWTAVSGALGVMILVSCRTQPKPPTTVTVTRIVVETAVPQTILVAATDEPDEVVTVEPPASKNLVICTTQEPITLYPYGSTLAVETAVLHAIYENDYTTLTYDLQPQGLAAIPSLAGDDAEWRPVTVLTGDIIVDAAGSVTTLNKGVKLIAASGEEITFDGSPATMNQLAVTFTMQPRVWSDGQPVTAADSVYSFQLDADPDTPTSKFITSRTASYEAVGERSVQWVGLPGFHDVDYATRFWRPLPRHLWSQFSPTELLTEPISSREPVGDGPFVLTEWAPGSHIRLEPNWLYYRADEGLPRLDSVLFRFYAENDQLIEDLLAGRCDLVPPEELNMSQIPLLLAAERNGLIRPYFQTGAVYEHIDFGINSWGYYGDGDGRPDWFEDVRVRQAIAMCTDRQGMIDEILYGRSHLNHSYIPTNHPLYPNDLTEWPYDVQAANALLDETGYLDNNNDGIREDPVSGLPFRVTLGAGDNKMQQRIAQYLQSNLRDCGIEANPAFLTTEDWYADGPDGPLFGRRFDLGEFAWIAGRDPACFLYASWEITGPADEKNRAIGQPYGGWDAANETGWYDPAYDAACRTARQSLPGQPAYAASHQEAQRIYARNLPSIPLFPRLKVAAAHPSVRNLQLDPTQPSALWNLYEIDIER